MIMVFALKCTTLYTVYCIDSGLLEQSKNVVWIQTYLSVVLCCYIEQPWWLLFSIQVLHYCLFRNMCKWFSIFGVHFEPFEKNGCDSPEGMEVLVLITTFVTWILWKIKNDRMMINYIVSYLIVFYIHCSGLSLVDGGM